MKKFNFNPNALTVGVALALGLGIATGVSASTSSGSASPSGGVQISNTATAEYSVDGIEQPPVTSNAVIVNINEIGSFTLVATQTDTKPNDDKNENVAISSPTGQATFTNTLTNEGNVKDTYTIKLSDTAGTIITGVTDKFGFTNEDTTPITVTIKNRADGSTASTSTITSGGQITLLPGQYAELSYSLTADGTGIAGDSGLATITATSSYITNNPTTGATATLVNENQAIVKLPNFAIVKTAANTNVDYTQATPTIDYTIKVTNQTGNTSADAVGVLVQDVLPTGLTVSGTPTVSVDGTGNSAGTVNVSSDLTKLSVSGVNLTVGSTLTITFKAAVNKTLVSSTSTVKNIATVYDNYDSSVPNIDNPTADIKDSTATGENTTKQPTDTNDSSQDVTFTNRGLTLDGSTTAELPPTTKTDGSNTANYSHNLVNTGNVAENNIVVKIADPDKNNAISIDKVSYTINGGTPQLVTLNPNGEFTIPSLPAGQTAVISYSVKTTGATVGSTEIVTVSVTPETIADKAIAAVTPKTDTTNVKGLALLKTQAIQKFCTGDVNSLNYTGSDKSLDAIPGDCIVYRIAATNTFTSKSLTNVTVNDDSVNWSSKKGTYQSGSILTGTNQATGSITSTPSGTPNTGAVVANFPTIAAGNTGTLQFIVKINP